VARLPRRCSMHSVVTCLFTLNPFLSGTVSSLGRHVHQNAVIQHANQAALKWKVRSRRAWNCLMSAMRIGSLGSFFTVATV
jgi:hypothetical protein